MLFVVIQVKPVHPDHQDPEGNRDFLDQGAIEESLDHLDLQGNEEKVDHRDRVGQLDHPDLVALRDHKANVDSGEKQDPLEAQVYLISYIHVYKCH